MSMGIKAARLASGKTQVEVAKETGMTVRGYQEFEARKNYSAILSGIKIAKALNKSIGDMENLFGETQSEPDGNQT